MFEEKVGTAYVELETRGQVNQQLGRTRQQLEAVEAQARRTAGAVNQADAARLRAAGRDPFAASLAGQQGPAPRPFGQPVPPLPRTAAVQPGAPPNPAQAAEAERAGQATRSFAARASEAAFGIGRAGATLALALTAGAAAAEHFVSKISPTAAATFSSTLDLLQAQIGRGLLPAFEGLTYNIFRFTIWLRQRMDESEKPPAEAGVLGNVFGLYKDVAETIANRPYMLAGPGPAVAFGGAALSRGLRYWGDDEHRRAGENLDQWMTGRSSRRAGMPETFVPPGGSGPVARYQTGEEYSAALNVAGLEAGGEQDPKTLLLRDQLKEMRDTKALVESLNANQQAMNQYLQAQGPAWR